MTAASSPYVNRPPRSLAEVEARRATAATLCALGGLHPCPYAPAAGPMTLCGCAAGACADFHVKQAAD